MTARMLVTWLAAMGVSVSSIGLSARDFAKARANSKEATFRLNRCQSDAERARRLRVELPPCLMRAQDLSPLGPRLHKVLASVNLAPGVLTNLAPQAGSTVPLPAQAGGGRREQLVTERVAIKLAPLTLPELGGFLRAWQTSETCQSISAIDVAPIFPERGSKPVPGSDLPVRASLTLESLTLRSSRGGR